MGPKAAPWIKFWQLYLQLFCKNSDILRKTTTSRLTRIEEYEKHGVNARARVPYDCDKGLATPAVEATGFYDKKLKIVNFP